MLENTNKEKQEEKQEEKQLDDLSVPVNTGAPIREGLMVIAFMFLFFGVWMANAPLASSVVAMGKVSAGVQKKIVQHLEGGIVDAIHVSNGDRVKKGDMLLKLRDVQIKSQLSIYSSQYQEALTLFARLQAEKEHKQSVVFAQEIQNSHAMQDQKNIFYSTKKSMQEEREINLSRIYQLKKQIDGLESLIESKTRRVASLQEEKQEWQSLYEQKLVDKQRIRELKREINSIEGDISNSHSQIAKLHEQVSELKNHQLLREEEFMEETLKKYVETKQKVSDLRSKIVALEDRLQRTAIKAPVDGTVVGLEVHTVGAVIQPGKVILEIVPKSAKLIVEAQIETKDVDKVKVGLLSDVMLAAFDMRDIDTLEGSVIYVSADSFSDPATHMPFYKVKVVLTEASEKKLLDKGYVLIPGMPATVMITIGDRTMLEYLLKPIEEMLLRSFNEE